MLVCGIQEAAMVRQSGGSPNELKRKWSIAQITRGDHFDDEVATDVRRARLEYDHDTDIDDDDDDDDDVYTSGTDDEEEEEEDEEEEDDDCRLTDATSTSSESELDDGAAESSVRIDRSSDDESRSPRSLDSDPGGTPGVQRSSRRRKPLRPTKSANPEDPKFKGVTVQFRTLIHDGEVQLMITAYFNCRKVSRRRCAWKSGETSPYSATDYSDTSLPEVTSSYNMRRGRQGQVYHNSGKQCASCCTRKTPLWRDAEDGTPLCNACGIRYKKYRVRCGHCWFVPKKESKTNQICSNCGERFRFSMIRLKHSIL